MEIIDLSQTRMKLYTPKGVSIYISFWMNYFFDIPIYTRGIFTYKRNILRASDGQEITYFLYVNGAVVKKIPCMDDASQIEVCKSHSRKVKKKNTVNKNDFIVLHFLLRVCVCVCVRLPHSVVVVMIPSVTMLATVRDNCAPGQFVNCIMNEVFKNIIRNVIKFRHLIYVSKFKALIVASIWFAISIIISAGSLFQMRKKNIYQKT